MADFCCYSKDEKLLSNSKQKCKIYISTEKKTRSGRERKNQLAKKSHELRRLEKKNKIDLGGK
jgi:hypothetical protein